MSANGSAVPQEASEFSDKGKGKGKAVDQPQDMELEDDESDEESGVEEVRQNLLFTIFSRLILICRVSLQQPEGNCIPRDNHWFRTTQCSPCVGVLIWPSTDYRVFAKQWIANLVWFSTEDEEDLDEIDPSNIITKQTRGKQIDWAEAEQKSKDAGDELEDDDDDDDEDFEAEDEDEEMRDWFSDPHEKGTLQSQHNALSPRLWCAEWFQEA